MGGEEVFYTLGFNLFFFPMAMLWFEYVRTRQLDVYSPLARDGNSGTPQPREGFLQWVLQVEALGDAEMRELAGLDGYVLLRYLLFCTKLCAYCSLGGSLLLPLYYTAHEPEGDKMNLFTMGNIPQGSIRLWVCCLFSYGFTAVFLYLSHLEYENFVRCRIRYFKGERDASIPEQLTFTVQVENIPPALSDNKRFAEYFERLHPGEVFCAHVLYALGPLDAAIARRTGLVRKLEAAVAYMEFTQRRPKLRGRCGGGEGVDEIDALQEQVDEVCVSIKSLQTQALQMIGRSGREDEEGGVFERDSPDDLEDGDLWGDEDYGSLRTDSIHGTHVLGPVASAAPALRGKVGSDRLQVVTEREAERKAAERKADWESEREKVSGEPGKRNPSPFASMSLGAQEGPVRPGNHRKSPPALEQLAHLTESTALLRQVSHIYEDLSHSFIAMSGFVTFKSRRAQVTSSRLQIISEDFPCMEVHPAPSPKDLLWANMSASRSSIYNMSCVTAVAYYAGLSGWSVVLALVAALSNLHTFESIVPGLQRLGGLGYAILQGLLPVLVIMYFNSTIAWIMTYVATKVERQRTQSAVQLQVFRWAFTYQIYNVYLILMASAATSHGMGLLLLRSKPYALLALLSSALPGSSAFFLNYIATSWLGGVPVLLLNRQASWQMWWYTTIPPPHKVTRHTLKSGPMAAQSVGYGGAFPNYLYVLCCVLLFWVISPLISMLATGFFYSSYLAWKYKFCFVVVRGYESGGELFHGVYSFSMIGLLASSIMSIAYMGVKMGTSQVTMLAPLPFLIIFCWRKTVRQFQALAANMAFQTAMEQDADFSQAEIISTFSDLLYQPPSLTSPALAYPYPHRILDTPLLTPQGSLSDIYVEDLPAGVDPEKYIKHYTSFKSQHNTKQRNSRNSKQKKQTKLSKPLEA